MKAFAAFALFACACARMEPVPAEAPKAQPTDPAAVDAVKQVSQDMGDAMVAGDIAKLDRIYGDDFATVGSSGVVVTKKTLLNDFESFHDKLVWYETGPIDVQVFGHVAVAQGGVKEKTRAVSSLGWISSKTARADGWSCGAQAPESLLPIHPWINPPIRRWSRAS